MFILALVCAHTAAAEVSYRTGIITTVDVDSNTFTVLYTDSGKTKSYSFPDKVNFINNGVTRHDKTLIEPGQFVELKFVKTGMTTKTEGILKGKVVQFDKFKGNGTLRLERTHKLVPFQFAKDLMGSYFDLPRVGDNVEFSYTLNEGDVTAQN